MIDLGVLPGSESSEAFGINDLGQIVGTSNTLSGGHAFLWQAGSGMIDLGVLPGMDISAAYAINNHGQVVGMSYPYTGLGARAFIWQAGGGMIDLGTLGGSYSEALGINDAAKIVGSSETAAGQRHAFVWQAGSGMTDLGTLPGRRFERGRWHQ